MKTKILMPLMALMLLLAACDRQQAGKTAPKAAVPVVLNQTNINPDDVFTVSRNGERVTIQWIVDLSACKGIRILRNATGKPQNRDTVVRLPAAGKEYVDSAPDAHAYWYWVGIVLPDGKVKFVGPKRAAEDVENTGNYVDTTSDMQLTVQRTENAVVVAWDLPNLKYKSIVIKRGSSPDHRVKRVQRKDVLKTLEWHGDLVDQLPDADADYWYWIEATREDGTVLSKGPIKAEFSAK